MEFRPLSEKRWDGIYILTNGEILAVKTHRGTDELTGIKQLGAVRLSEPCHAVTIYQPLTPEQTKALPAAMRWVIGSGEVQAEVSMDNIKSSIKGLYSQINNLGMNIMKLQMSLRDLRGIITPEDEDYAKKLWNDFFNLTSPSKELRQDMVISYLNKTVTTADEYQNALYDLMSKYQSFYEYLEHKCEMPEVSDKEASSYYKVAVKEGKKYQFPTKKKIIRLTEEDLHAMIKSCLKELM